MPKEVKQQPKKITRLFPSVSTTAEEEQEPEKLRVAAYCRVSTMNDEQQESFNAQRSFYQKYLTNHPAYHFAGIYADEGISGTQIKKRVGFQQMMSDCRDGKLDMIMTKSVSRFGRNTVDCLSAVRELKLLGVDVFFEKENLHTLNGEGELLLTLMSAVAEAESFSISENVKWGLRRRFEQGKLLVLGYPPYGYDKDNDGRLVINDEQAPVVRRIFSEYLDGYSFMEIANHLIEDGIPTQKGCKEWANAYIISILQNEKMAGNYCYQKSFVIDPLSKKRRKNINDLPRYYLYGTHPNIVEQGIWNFVQAEMKRRSVYEASHHTSLAGESLLGVLRGRVICAECGFAFGKRQHSKWLGCTAFNKVSSPEERGKLKCHSTRLQITEPERVFIEAWNVLCKNPVWTTAEDILVQYHSTKLQHLLAEVGQIDVLNNELVRQTLDYISVSANGAMNVIFLAGARVSISPLQNETRHKK